MDEARSLSYSINVRANTSQAEASIRNVTSSLVDLQGSGVKGSISLLWLETIAQMGTQFSLNTAGKIEPQHY